MAIIAFPRKGLTRFERLYFFEADDVEKQRTNVRKITVADGTDDVDKENSDDDMTDDGDEDVEGTEDTGTDDDEDVDLEADDSDMDDGEDGGEDTGDDTGNDGGGDGGDVDLEDDGKDMDGGGDSDSGDTDGDDGDDGGSEKNITDIADATRKRAIFSRIHDLHDAIGTYVDKLTSLMTTASDNVAIYRRACDDLDELMTYTYDFMIVRFKNATYTESMLLYQRVLTAVSLVLDELGAGLDKIRRQQQANSPEKQNSKSKKMDENLAYSSTIARVS